MRVVCPQCPQSQVLSLSGHDLRAGGHPGGICRPAISGQPAALVAPDRLAVYAGNAGDLALGRAALEQRVHRRLLVRFQDIHSLGFPRGRPDLVSCQQVPAAPAFTPCPRSNQVGEFDVAISGGVWVAIGGQVA